MYRRTVFNISLPLFLVLCLMATALQPVFGEPAAKTAPALEGVVNLNTATEKELVRLPQVGETVARRIVDFRDKNGPFQRPEDLMNVKGIGEKTFDKLRRHLVVDGETTLKGAPEPKNK